MNIKRFISFLIFCLIFQVFGISQDQIKILDQSSKILGRFKTQLFQVDGPRLKQLRGTAPRINATGEEQELILRLEELNWFDEKNKDVTVNINRSDIKLSDSKNLRLSSDRTSFSLSTDSKIASDIKFKVYSNGEYTISIPFTAGDISSRFVQSFSLENILPSQTVNAPIGEIADVKKAWKEVDKKDSQAIKDFIAQYQDNEIAVNEGLLVIADRTLKRVGNSDNSNLNDPGERDQFITSSTREMGPHLLTKRDNNIFNLDLSGLSEVDINMSNSDDIEVYNNGGNVYDLKLKGSKSYTITVTEISTGATYEFVLNNEFRAKIEKVEKDFLFSIEGGISPFTVEFFKMDEEIASADAQFTNLIPDVANQISITNAQLSTSGMEGKYEKVIIRDFTTDASATFPINLVVTPEKGMSKILLGVLALLILVGGGAMFYFNNKKNTKRNEYLAKAKAIQAQQKSEMQAQAAAYVSEDNTPPRNIEESRPPRKITINKSERSVVPPNGGEESTFISSGKMKITKRAGKRGSLTLEEFNTVLKEDSYAFMDLQEIWPDTAIRELFLSKECIKALGAFLKHENLDKAIVEMEGAIPEVGGFLMGNYNVDESTGFIRVTMDEFVPFVPEYHDVFKIEIGTQTLVQELGDAQDTHPNKDVIGWFHTHPGHGLFLSNSDLSVQRHFPQKYQIAMEIDSLTPTLDTAFFTRKQNGTINNVEHRKQGAKWFSWKKIEKI